jgi:hypothetical protein
VVSGPNDPLEGESTEVGSPGSSSSHACTSAEGMATAGAEGEATTTAALTAHHVEEHLGTDAAAHTTHAAHTAHASHATTGEHLRRVNEILSAIIARTFSMAS